MLALRGVCFSAAVSYARIAARTSRTSAEFAALGRRAIAGIDHGWWQHRRTKMRASGTPVQYEGRRAMALSPEQVRQVAALAALELSPAEIDRLTTELGAILAYVEQLNELDTSDVPLTTHLAVESLPFRPDRPEPGLEPRSVLAEAPRTSGSAFAVPTFVDDA